MMKIRCNQEIGIEGFAAAGPCGLADPSRPAPRALSGFRRIGGSPAAPVSKPLVYPAYPKADS